MNTTSKKKDLLTKMGAAWVSCMTLMVEGNMPALTLKHAYIAGKTSLASIMVYLAATTFRKDLDANTESILLALSVASVDWLIHPTHFGPWWAEAVATGIMAGIINRIAAWLLKSN